MQKQGCGRDEACLRSEEGFVDQVMLELSHNGRVVFFQAEKWEERHSARRAHRVLG